MKNNFRILLLIFIITLCKSNVFALEDFVFESKSIEIEKTENKLLAKDGVKISTNDGLLIYANESVYDKNLKKLDFNFEAHEIDGMGHSINLQALEYAQNFLKNL